MPQSPIRQVRLGVDLDAWFDAAIKERGVTASEFMRQAVMRERGAVAVAEQPAARPTGEPSTERLTVRLPDFVLEGARSRARQSHMPVSRWVAALVQSNVASDPVLTAPEIEAIEACAYQLAGIGRNVNQIAKALNDAHFQTERVKVEFLESIIERISKTRETIRSLVRASRNSWTVPDGRS